MLAQDFLHNIEQEATKCFDKEFKIHGLSTIHGGSISSSFLVKSNIGEFFLKVNSAEQFPNMFSIEKDSLIHLKTTNTLSVPQVYLEGKYNDQTYLFLEYIAQAKDSKRFWESFGKGLASLHKNQLDSFGYEKQNYIGSLIQINDFKANWIDFFIENRLDSQAKLAYSQGLLSREIMTMLDKLYLNLPGIFPSEKASLLHGDLWSGNFICGPNARPFLIDPALYYGNREMDIAMSHLFGGFKPRFYESYQESFPLKVGWEERIDLCNLYPLLVHVNLFGPSYASRVKNIVQKYV